MWTNLGKTGKKPRRPVDRFVDNVDKPGIRGKYTRTYPQSLAKIYKAGKKALKIKGTFVLGQDFLGLAKNDHKKILKRGKRKKAA